MKKSLLYILFGILSFSGIGLWSCNDAEFTALPNAIYFVDAEARDEFDAVIRNINNPELNVAVRMTRKLDHPVTLTLAVDYDFVDKHFEKHNERLTVLPADNWILYDSDGTPRAGDRIEVTIPANTITTMLPVTVISDFADDDINQYCLPLTITDVSEDITVLENLKTVLYQFNRPFSTKAFWRDANIGLSMRWGDNIARLTNWTFEFYFCFDFEDSTVKGVEDNCAVFQTQGMSNFIYVRPYSIGNFMDVHVGEDAPSHCTFYPEDGAFYTTNAELRKKWRGVWHHFAIVNDKGKVTTYWDLQEQATETSPLWAESDQLSGLSFWATSGRVGLSEVRVWRTARTDKQLSRSHYTLSPDDDLVAWYRMDGLNADGEFQPELLWDASGNGRDIVLAFGDGNSLSGNKQTETGYRYEDIYTDNDLVSFISPWAPSFK